MITAERLIAAVMVSKVKMIVMIPLITNAIKLLRTRDSKWSSFSMRLTNESNGIRMTRRCS